MSKNFNDKTGSLMKNVTSGGDINSATVITNNSALTINYIFYFLCLIIILVIYIGPYVYYKIIKKKKLNPQKRVIVNHVI